MYIVKLCSQTEPLRSSNHVLCRQTERERERERERREIRVWRRVKIRRGERKSVAWQRGRTIWIFRVAGGARVGRNDDAGGCFRAISGRRAASLPAGGGDGCAAFDLRLGWGDIAPRRSSTRFSQCRIPPVVSFFS